MVFWGVFGVWVMGSAGYLRVGGGRGREGGKLLLNKGAHEKGGDFFGLLVCLFFFLIVW